MDTLSALDGLAGMGSAGAAGSYLQGQQVGLPGQAGVPGHGGVPYPGGPTLQLAHRPRNRRGGGAKDEAGRQAQAHRRWTSIGSTSDEWKGWEKATKEVIDSKGAVGDRIKFVVPPRAEANDQTYVLFALDGPFQLTSFSQAGRRFAIFERMPADHMIESGEPREYEPDPQKAAAQELADAARDLVKIQTEIAMGLRDKDGRVLPASAQPAEWKHSPEEPGAVQSQPDDQATPGALPGTQNGAEGGPARHPPVPQEQHGTSGSAAAAEDAAAAQDHSATRHDSSGASGSHSTVVGAGGGLLLAANMTLLLTERPGASLVVGPCYANVQEGSQAMQNGSYAIGLSEIFAIDFEAGRRLEAQKAEAAAIEAAFLRELEKEEGKKSGRKSKSKKKKKKRGEEEEPIPEDSEELPFPEPAAAYLDSSDSEREDDGQPTIQAPASPDGALRSPGPGGASPTSPGGWLVVGEKKKSGQSTKGGSESLVEPLDLQQESATPEESSTPQQPAPGSANSEPGSAGKKSRGRRGGRRRKRGGKGSTPDSATANVEQQHHHHQQHQQQQQEEEEEEEEEAPAINAEHSSRVQSQQQQQQHGWVHSSKSAAAWQDAGAGLCVNNPSPARYIRAQNVVTGPRYCEPGATVPLMATAVHANTLPDPWCSRGGGPQPQPQQQSGKTPAPAVRPNWGSLRLGNGLFDPSAGFLGPSDSSPQHEPALMQSIVGALGLDDL